MGLRRAHHKPPEWLGLPHLRELVRNRDVDSPGRRRNSMVDVKAVMAVVGLMGCASDPATTDQTIQEANLGEQMFSSALPHTNGRSCATCHVAADGFSLTPAHV